MTIEEKIKYVLRKYPATKFSRAEFMWKYCETYYEVAVYMLKSQFLEFWKNEATIERKLRDVLREPEFKLKPKQDQKRYSKAATFKEQLKPPERKQWEYIFGKENYHQTNQPQ